MENDVNHFFISYSFIQDSCWKNAKSKQKAIFLEILQRTSWKKVLYRWKGETILLFPGQLATSFRALELFSGHDISKNDVISALKYFSKSGTLKYEIKKGITVVTILVEDICEKNASLYKRKYRQKKLRRVVYE